MTEAEVVWTKRVREWKESGKTLKEFSASQPYRPATLGWWAWQLRQRSQRAGRLRAEPKSGDSIKLARVIRRPEAQGESRAMAVEMRGARILVERGFDRELLTEIVRALGGGR